MSRLLLLSLVATASALPPEQAAFFESKVRPVLAEHCYGCHSARAEKLKGGLHLDSRAGWQRGGDSGEPALVPGDVEGSALIHAIRRTDPDTAMPPKKPLAAQQIADLEAWVKMGAPDPRDGSVETKRADKTTWWSLQPLANPAPPDPPGLPEAWRENPIDRFVFAKLAEKGLAPNPPAEPRALIRRLSYDLTGLPPTPEEVEAFTAASIENQKSKIENLLASPAYGERWGRHWLDVVRFGESNGFERNITIDSLWPFRDYVIRSFNDDKPFNRFIVEQLAGDVVAPGDPAVEVGTAFLVCGPYDNVNQQDAVQTAVIRANTLDDLITATGTAFLGLTVNCARCHHHKFDPIPQEDYYRLRAAFEGVTHGERMLASAEEKQRVAAARKPLEETRTALKAKRKTVEKTDAAQLAWIDCELVRLDTELRAVPQPPLVWAGNFAQPKEPTWVFKSGDPQKRGATVIPASLSVLDRSAKAYELPADASEGQRRLALAQWIAGDDNALTLRVLANRVWQHHFGTGLVETPGDFGFLGAPPSHPGLLDFLAQRLRAHGWRLKALHREIVTSQTYRQSAAWREDAARMDKDARLLWRFPPRRLTGEELRDTLLAITGQLDRRMGGPGFRLYQYVQDNVATYHPLDAHGPETYRRAVYHQNARAQIVDVLSDFDLPDNAAPAPRRVSTTNPLQTLTLLNHRFTLDMAAALAARLPADDPARAAFRLTLQREPSLAEREAAAKLLAARGSAAFCRALLNSNELLHLD